MTYTVSEVARQTGVSVRTLHYYDEIGLLCPASVTDSGYRLYDEDSLGRLQQILFLRELDFPLKDILGILQHPDYDRPGMLRKQRQLLLLKRRHLDGLIHLIDNTLKGEQIMSFEEFDTSDIQQAQEQYKQEVQERWGNTEAYRENKRKAASYTKEDWKAIQQQAEVLYQAFAAHIGEDVSRPAVQQLVADWQAYITKNYYTCTKDILAGLGQMYTADERFCQNIDAHAPGLADFMSRAIEVYVSDGNK